MEFDGSQTTNSYSLYPYRVKMIDCDLIIRKACVLDGTGSEPVRTDIAVCDGRIRVLGSKHDVHGTATFDAEGLVLAPGFIDVHTHDDIAVLRKPEMLPKISQGVTTVIVGNCGISASPVTLRGALPDPMNLLGEPADFCFPTFASYVEGIRKAQPAVNVAALIGHTALRNNHLDRLDRSATDDEIAAMRMQLDEALASGALGLSTGLAYLSANSASPQEVASLAQSLATVGAVYTTHMRNESERVLDAMDEAFETGRTCGVPVIISHLKCAGIANWGRCDEVLHALEHAQQSQAAACDCYPYAAGSSTLDLRQVDERVKISITWSTPHPEAAGQTLAQIADKWNTSQLNAARELMPAGAIYHSISEQDMRSILAHSATMIGSDGLPNDPRPHPRLWGTFPRVLGRYSRDERLFSLATAVHKMTGLPAQRFGLAERGLIRDGYAADFVLFDPDTIIDTATFDNPEQPAKGITAVWVNGVLTYTSQGTTGVRAGRYLPRGKTPWIQ
jgi:N-acyl-D-aspartate/D-glutamate deacylase